MGNFAADISIDDASEGKDIVDRNAFGILLFGIGSYHNGSVLTAGVGVFGNIDSKLYFAGFVGGDGASGFGNGDPVGDFGKSGNIADVGLIIFADYIIR